MRFAPRGATRLLWRSCRVGSQFATGFGLQVVLARLFAPAVFGQFAFVLLVQGLVASFRTIQAGEFLICVKDDWRRAYDTVFTVDLALSSLTAVAVVALAGPLMRAAGQPDLALALHEPGRADRWKRPRFCSRFLMEALRASEA